jgi:hypothetical protein
MFFMSLGQRVAVAAAVAVVAVLLAVWGLM